MMNVLLLNICRLNQKALAAETDSIFCGKSRDPILENGNEIEIEDLQFFVYILFSFSQLLRTQRSNLGGR